MVSSDSEEEDLKMELSDSGEEDLKMQLLSDSEEEDLKLMESVWGKTKSSQGAVAGIKHTIIYQPPNDHIVSESVL